jgi:integron integrase
MGVLAKFREQASGKDLQPRTVKTYEFWIRKFFDFSQGKPASEWSGEMVSAWLYRLDQDRYSSVSRKQALCALVFVFKNVLGKDPGDLNLPKPPREKFHLREIPTREELARIFAGMTGQPRLMAALMYGSGLRVEETCKLRVQDIDLANFTIRIHGGKGDKDRLCLLPQVLAPHLQRQIAWRAALHDKDLAEGAGFVDLPGRLALKYPAAARELRWQFLFPSQAIRAQRRWHSVPESVQKAMRQAVRAAGITRRVTPHTLRHAFATHALRAGNDIKTVQDLLGHEHLDTTMIYLHGDSARGVSPLDLPAAALAAPVPHLPQAFPAALNF